MRAPLPYARSCRSSVMQPSRLGQSARRLAGGSVRSRLGLQLDLPVGVELRRTGCPGGLLRLCCGAVLDRRSVGIFDGSEAAGDAGLAGGDGLAVAPAVGALWQAAARPLDLADVGLSLVGMRGDGEHGDVGGGGVQDQADGLGVGVAPGQGQDPRAIYVGPGLFWVDLALPDPVVEVDEFDVGSVDLVADAEMDYGPPNPG
jgi:hypothetical protein